MHGFLIILYYSILLIMRILTSSLAGMLSCIILTELNYQHDILVFRYVNFLLRISFG